MGAEPKEWINTTRRSNKNKSGGTHVYVNSQALEFAGVPNNQELQVKIQPLNNGKVLLKFRVKEFKHCKHLFNDGKSLRCKK